MENELFYYMEMKNNYENLIISYKTIISNYQTLIENNENFMRILHPETKYMKTDNQLFYQYVYEYKNIVSGLELYINILNERIRELTPIITIPENQCCICKNN